MELHLPNNHAPMQNRELGLIQFYKRVLAKATDKTVPILERLNYLCIVSKNCDELFEVRVSRLLKLNREDPNKILPDGLTSNKALALVRSAVSELYDDLYNVYHHQLLPNLLTHNIAILAMANWSSAQKKFTYDYFVQQLQPILNPIAIDPSHPFPKVPNKNLHFAIELEGTDEFNRSSKIAIIEVPRILPRIIKLPATIANKKDSFILLQDIIKLHVNEFFYGIKVRGCYPFRVTRASDFTLKATEKNLRFAVTQELHNRRFAACSRLELDII
jgi:polyphosphate kinase